jgi:peptidoglycan/LPS O-acetylase OafA/YrhL
MPDPGSQEQSYIPALDGWRALSIGLVLLHHSQVRCSIPVLGALLQSLSRAGEVGVELFFSISGLLICSRLLDEESRSGAISIRNFYLRRFFRIVPAAFFYLLTLALLAAFRLIPLPALDWFGALFFFRNYVMLHDYIQHSPLALHWYTGHFWSLSIEEHFYLFLPAVLVTFKRTRVWMLLFITIAITFRRAVLAHLLHADYQFNFRTDTHADALLIPAMIALVLYPLARNPAARQRITAWSFSLLLAIEIGLLTLPIPMFFTLQAIVLAFLILSTVLHPQAFAGRILEYRPMRWIGRISYSLYLWQQLFFGADIVAGPAHLAWLRQPPWNLLALMACASFSYYVIERPMVRFGHNFVRAQDIRRINLELSAQSVPPMGGIGTAS